MKCVKELSTGKIKRVSDDEAAELVTWSHVYVPKSEFKEQVRNAAD